MRGRRKPVIPNPERGTPRALFRAEVRRLRLRARLDLLARGATAGLFAGLLSGALLAALAGTVRLPLSASAFAGIAAAAGTLAGTLSALLRRAATRRLLIDADRTLGSRELASTALELAARPGGGPIAEAVIEDAAALLARSGRRRILGAPRLPFLPWLTVAAALAALAIAFPFDLRALFAARPGQDDVLAMIGEDLQGQGRRLEDAAREQNFGRSLALSQELAQLGRDLENRTIQGDEALDRMDDLERRMAEEFGLQMEGSPTGTQPGASGTSQGNSGSAEGEGGGSGGEQAAGSLEPDSQNSGSPNALKDLSDALSALREAKRQAEGAESGAGGKGQASSSAQGSGSDASQPGSSSLPPGAGTGSGNGSDEAARGGGPSEDRRAEESGTGASGSGIGTTPVPDAKGPAKDIARAGNSEPLRAEATTGEGESTRLLVRALPDWTGARLPEEQVLRRYASQAESALARDEIPLELKEYVKGYFTVIGIGASDGKQ